MRRNALYKTGAFVLLLVFIALSTFQQQKLDTMRNNLGINDSRDIKDKSPAMILTTVGLGSFRGFIANLLFLRSNRLQEERRYYEVHQLAKWVRNLQPRYTKAISFMAWNMSYNISVTFDTPEERWVWVRKGIDLYQDALENHSGDPDLYWEFGWIFQHKMGMNLDDANRYYKQQWALQMVKLLGEKSKLAEIAGASKNTDLLHVKLANLKYKEWNELLAALKMSFEDVRSYVLADEEHELPERITKFLKDEKWQEEVVKFIIAGEEKRYELETLKYLLEGMVDVDEILKKTPDSWSFKQFEKRFRELGRTPLVFTDLIELGPTAKAQVVNTIDLFMRDRWAHKVYKLDTRRMLKINEEYGALDWRVAETHAIYWAKKGLEVNPDHIPCIRMVSQALKDVIDRGRLLYFHSDTHTSIDWTYNVALVDKVSEIQEEIINSLAQGDRGTFETGYKNFLIDAVVALYVHGSKKRSAAYYKKMRQRYPEDEKLNVSLHKFVTPEINEDIGSMNENQARGILYGFLRNSYKYIIWQEPDLASFWWNRADSLYKSYKKRTANRKGRQGWTRSFREMAYAELLPLKRAVPTRAAALQAFVDVRLPTNAPPGLLKRPE